MQLRWAPVAAEDLFRVIEYIQQENPVAAQRIAKTIYESAGSLKSFPNKGRTGRVEGTRELPLPPLPFVVVLPGPRRWCGNCKCYPRRPEMAAKRLKLIPDDFSQQQTGCGYVRRTRPRPAGSSAGLLGPQQHHPGQPAPRPLGGRAGKHAIVIGVYGVLFGILGEMRKSLRPGIMVHAWHDAITGLLVRLVRT